MTALTVSFAILLLVLLGSGLWVGLALMATALITLFLYRDMNVLTFLAGDIWRSLNTPELVALPLFIVMGEILLRSHLSAQLFRGLAPFMRHLPGSLLHTNILGATLFAAVSGSSAATTATIGRMTLPELQSRGYDRDLAMGSLAGAGTLGFLIPPSLILILYGVLADVSILDLFLAGIIPGLILALVYMGYLALRVAHDPSLAPRSSASTTWREKFRAALSLIPVILLITLVIGSMYAGIAGPSEAATIGIAGALLLALLQGGLTRQGLIEALLGAVRTSAMIGLIIAGAFFLAKAVAIFGIPAALAGMIDSMNLPPYVLIALLLIFYIFLGMLLDGFSVIVMTLPVALPMVTAAGYSPLWFGIFLVIAVEMGQVTPPVGFNLFVIKDLTGESMTRIARAAWPFFVIMVLMAALITFMPEMVTWLIP